jgi:glucose uptake protein
VKECRFGLFCWDYAVGAFPGVSLVYAYTMGSSGHAHRSFLVNVHVADASNIGWALLPGVIFNFATLLLVAGIDMAGLATAFPVSVGIAMVAGVFF